MSLVWESPGQEADERERARARFEEAIAAADRGEIDEAVAALEESYDLYPHPGTLLNLAVFLDRGGRRLAAREAYEDLLERYGTVISDETAARARVRLEALESGLAAITVRVEPAGATIAVNGAEIGPLADGAPVWLEPGDHRVEARREGFEPAAVRHRLEAGQQLAIALSLTALPDERGLLVVESSTPGAMVALDDGPLEPLPLRRRLAAGEVTLRVMAEGHAPASPRRVEVPAGGALHLAVDLSPLEPEPPAATPAEPPAERRGFWRSPWPWVIGVLAAGGLAAGLGVGLAGDEPHWELTTP